MTRTRRPAPTRTEWAQATREVTEAGVRAPGSMPFLNEVGRRMDELATCRDQGIPAPAYAEPTPLTDAERAARELELDARVLTGVRAGEALTASAKALIAATRA